MNARAGLGVALGLALLALFCVHARRNFVACYTGGGDSPHYLLMAKSLARDGDLWLSKQERSIEANYEDLPFELDSRVISEERPYCVHPIGAPLVFAPAYLIGGRQAVLMEIALISWLTALALWFYLSQVTQDRVASGLVTLSVALTVPFFPLCANEYTEMVALHLEVLALLLGTGVTGGPGDRPKLLFIGLVAGALPWVHVRYLPVAVAVGACAWLRAERRLATRAWLVAPALALVAGLYAWGVHVTGAFALTLPFTLSGGNAATGLSIGQFIRKGLLGHLVDQQGGLLVHAPHYALAVLGARAVWTRWRGEACIHLSIALTTLAVVGSYYNWSGHWGVPCRFLLVLTPGLALALVPVVRAAIARGSAGLLAVAPLLVLSLLVSGTMLRWPPLQLSMEWTNVNLGAVFVHAYRETGLPLVSALPRFIYTPHARDYYLAFTLLVVFGAWLYFAAALIERRPHTARAGLLAIAAFCVWSGTAAIIRPPGDPLAEDPRWTELDTEFLLGYPRFYEIIASKAMARRRPDVARRCLNKVLDLRPRYGPVYAQIASIADRRADSERWARRGLEVIDDPEENVTDRIFWRGFLHAQAGHVDQARADLTEYLRRPGQQASVAQRLVQELNAAPGTGR